MSAIGGCSGTEGGCSETRSKEMMTARFVFVALLAASLSWPAAAQSPHSHQHGFHGASQWAQVFDDPARDEWQKPHEVIVALRIPADALIADIGAGTGYFASRFAHMAPQGRVYAVDTEPDMVEYLTARAKREGLKNLEAVQGEVADARLPRKVDLAVFVDVYHHVAERERYLRRLRGSLREAGRVAVIDFRMDAPIGPPVAGRIAPEQVKREFADAGYVLEREHGFLPYQYFLVFRPQRP
jgi:SAM-dependent methyltransferase